MIRRAFPATDAAPAIGHEHRAYQGLAAAVLVEAIWDLTASPRHATEAATFLLNESRAEGQTWARRLGLRPSALIEPVRRASAALRRLLDDKTVEWGFERVTTNGNGSNGHAAG